MAVRFEMKKPCPGSKYQETIFAKEAEKQDHVVNYFSIPSVDLYLSSD